MKQGGDETADRQWELEGKESTLCSFSPTGKFVDHACGSVECEKVHARTRMGSPMVPSDWTRKVGEDIKDKFVTCKGCGERGTDWHHLVFDCTGHAEERKELFTPDP